MLRKILNLALGEHLVDALVGKLPSTNNSNSHAYAKAERQLISQEAAIGAAVLGPVSTGRTRQFFCLDSHTWVWNEQWYDQAGKLQSFHVQYDVRPNGILKRLNGGTPSLVSGQELKNFDMAVERYYYAVSSQVYGRKFATV